MAGNYQNAASWGANAPAASMAPMEAPTQPLSPVMQFRNILNDPRFRNRVRTSAGDNSNVFLASMLDLYESDSDLQRCDPQKVATECLKAASLNLPIVKSLGFAYVVPFKGTPTFIIGYKGLIQLALRSGQFRHLNTGMVFEGEQIRTNRIAGQMEISGERTSDKAIGYFAYFQLVNGFEKSAYMTTEEIVAHARKYSKAYNKGPWQDNFDEMAKKTLLRRLLKYAPMSAEMQKAETYEVDSALANVDRGAAVYANSRVIDTSPDNPGEALPATPAAPAQTAHSDAPAQSDIQASADTGERPEF